ncbi:MAG: aquaporin [Acidimicrobiales bacterium]
MPTDLSRRLFAEALGTALLVAAVVGSGIAAQRLSPGDTGLQLLENAVATAAALVAIILAVGPVSGAHLNPAVTLAARILGSLTTAEALCYAGAQMAGGAVGAAAANVMFDLPAIELSDQARSSGALWTSEAVATFGLLVVIFGVVRSGRSSLAPFAVGAYIGAAYFFTSSTSFANPAVTAARALSNTFAGIAPSSVPAFVIAQLAGAVLAVGAARVLYPSVAVAAPEVVLPHPHGPEREHGLRAVQAQASVGGPEPPAARHTSGGER